jgi:hypothetical protein
MDFQSVCPAGLQPAETRTADNMFAGHTGHCPMFRTGAHISVIVFQPSANVRPRHGRVFDQIDDFKF